MIGRTHGPGPGNNSIDYLEPRDKLPINIRDNFLAPIHLARIADEFNIQYVYLGTGCIFQYSSPENKDIFSETDTPNFFGSCYSILKGFTEQELKTYKNVLQLRIRMPIVPFSHPRNFIDKIVSYPKIVSIENSMTVLTDMFPIIESMIETNELGVYNMTNPGTVTHDWILKKYKELVDFELRDWELVQSNGLDLKSERSNNHLDTTKLENYCLKHGLKLDSIKDSIENNVLRPFSK